MRRSCTSDRNTPRAMALASLRHSSGPLTSDSLSSSILARHAAHHAEREVGEQTAEENIEDAPSQQASASMRRGSERNGSSRRRSSRSVSTVASPSALAVEPREKVEARNHGPGATASKDEEKHSPKVEEDIARAGPVDVAAMLADVSRVLGSTSAVTGGPVKKLAPTEEDLEKAAAAEVRRFHFEVAEFVFRICQAALPGVEWKIGESLPGNCKLILNIGLLYPHQIGPPPYEQNKSRAGIVMRVMRPKLGMSESKEFQVNGEAWMKHKRIEYPIEDVWKAIEEMLYERGFVKVRTGKSKDLLADTANKRQECVFNELEFFAEGGEIVMPDD
ncbi:unnamed protein product [Amoebophrya sp. A25]|nr:unnamed protein product [Amoebophrya sp. A25]|eukprot:GSA25T00011445001.1